MKLLFADMDDTLLSTDKTKEKSGGSKGAYKGRTRLRDVYRKTALQL